jgi:hypothetical protein
VHGPGGGGPGGGGGGEGTAPGPLADVTPTWCTGAHSVPMTPKHCLWKGPTSAPCHASELNFHLTAAAAAAWVQPSQLAVVPSYLMSPTSFPGPFVRRE